MTAASVSRGRGQKLSTGVKLSYGLGEAAEGVKSATLETFLFFFYVQVVGLSGSLAGLALLIALVFDGLVDPVIGHISDGTRTRLGRRHPFLYVAPLPLAVALYFLFSPPPGMTPGGTFGWMLVFTILSRFMQSIYFVPHMALGAELSTDFDDRISVASYRNIFSFVGRLLVLAISFSIFFRPTAAIPQGQLNGSAYPPLSLACGAIVVAVVLLSAAGTQRRALESYRRVKASGPAGATRIVTSLANAFRMRSFAIYFFAILISYVLGGVQAALGVHINTFYWMLSPGGVQAVFVANTLGFMVGSLLARPLAGRLDKRTGYVVSVVISVAVNVGPITLSRLGVLPPMAESALVPVLAVSAFTAGCLGGPAMVIAGAMLADVADAYELRYGAQSEGLLFGASAFTRKASLGVGGALAGIALDLIHFPRGVGVDQVPRAAAEHLAILYGPALFIFTVVSMSLMWFYDLTREKHADILRRLDARRTTDER